MRNVGFDDSFLNAMKETSSTRSEIFSDDLPPGTTLLGGAFELQEVLGRGGFGITYRATNRRLERDVAIKELFTFGCQRSRDFKRKNVVAEGENAVLFRQAQSRFREQARGLAPLRHTNIVRVYELIEENDTLYLVMELLRGQTLLEVVKTRGALPENEACLLIRKLGGALEAVHNLGLLHLDIKPENVWQTPDGRLVLMDFDLVQKRPRGEDLGTRPLGETFRSGTPGYAPLEQYSNVAPFSPATDIYALGATLFHLATGNAPPSPLENSGDDAPPIPQNLSENARETLSRALQPIPQNRPQSVREFLDLLDGRALETSAPTTTSSTRSPTKVLSQPPSVAVSNATQTSSSNSVAPNIAQNVAASNAAINSVASTTSARAPSGKGFVAASALDNHLKSRVWRVAIEESKLRDLQWPALCPCCGESCGVNTMDFYEIGKGSRSWKVPHCNVCAPHADAARTAVFVSIWGMVGGTLISFVGLAMRDLWMGPFGILVYFSTLTYGLLKTSVADSLTKPECVDKKIAVSCVGTHFKNGRNVVVFEFRRPDYAEAFRQVNNAIWA